MRYLEIPLREDGTATLRCYLLDPMVSSKARKIRPAMLICPGGAYLSLSNKEGEPVAARWLGYGYQCFVVMYKHYVVADPTPDHPDPEIDCGAHYPEPTIDLMHAMAIVRAHADEWAIDAGRVYCMGFSAGGHVVGTLAERFDDAELLKQAKATADVAKPTGIVLGYPMVGACDPTGSRHGNAPWLAAVATLMPPAIFGTDNPTVAQETEIDLALHARPDMPRTFVWLSAEDEALPPTDTLDFVKALWEKEVPCELHMYQTGPHGTSLCDWSSEGSPQDLQPYSAHWVGECLRWLDRDARQA